MEEDDNNYDDNAAPSAELAAEIAKFIKVTTNNKPISSYGLPKNWTSREERSKYPDVDANKSILCLYFFWNEVMTTLPICLRNIFNKSPKKCTIFAILAVVMYEFIEYKAFSCSTKEVEDFITSYRSIWALVNKDCGDCFNLGQKHRGNILTHLLLAFCPADCKINPHATDEVDKMWIGNKTLRYVLRSMLRDHLNSLLDTEGTEGAEVTADESEQIGLALSTMSDLGIEVGQVGNNGKGNKIGPYKLQVEARHEGFIEEHKDDLKIPGGGGKSYTGVHMNALIGGLDVVLRAILTYKTTGLPLRVQFQSTRERQLLLNFDNLQVHASHVIVWCPYPHPNSFQQWLTVHHSQDVLSGLMDLSQSVAWQPSLDGAMVTINGRERRLHVPATEALSNAVQQRFMLRKNNNKTVTDADKAKIEKIEEVKSKTTTMNEDTKRKAAEIAEKKKKIRVLERKRKRIENLGKPK
jgi:hypothetical protein